MPHLQAQVEDGQGDWREENGRPALAEVERDGTVQLPASAAPCLRHLQELRGPFACCLHGRQWCCHAWQGDLLRAQRGCQCRGQEEVMRHNTTCWGAVVCGLHWFSPRVPRGVPQWIAFKRCTKAK